MRTDNIYLVFDQAEQVCSPCLFVSIFTVGQHCVIHVSLNGRRGGRGEWRHWPLVDTNKLVWPKLNGTLVGVAGTARPHCHSQTFYRARGTPPLLSYILYIT